jgi:speckle-type POZ protein
MVSESQLKTENGSHQFKIDNYSHIRGMGIGKCVKLGTFTIGRYKWLIKVFPDCYNQESSDYIYINLSCMRKVLLVKQEQNTAFIF